MPIKRLFQKKDQAALFWQWFKEVQQDYYQLSEENYEPLFNQLEKKLRKVHKDLAFEFSADLINGKREFIISADGVEELFPVVRELVDQAPSLNGFDIIAFRQPSEEGCHISIDGLTLTDEDVYFDYLYDPEAELVDLRFFIKGFDAENMAYDQAVFIMMDTVLGEYDAATKVGSIEMRKLHEKEGLYSISELRKQVIR
ncbi:hypothetical protein RRU94_05340 [Domibacillus sp. DTU_2020_1001157_1_SI_ALB_TIR_016]|uniref:hypothetical protein n=1 Tax=Domibacillus sp. DTU_2020_1001157_1_SI_ALB_TIR_016 TaxID=3077789 RepID=UPI0028EEA3BE|nr:hypothetical protein [Domibacillus sp. DTU_2020_1001157_1_SI_ALB_TIR_016]WNS77903.1 hypothetical protein RRU94_05340 [Domibacillus sp. DTU_2020_1001157_1_SI_ALB_TIR_016]